MDNKLYKSIMFKYSFFFRFRLSPWMQDVNWAYVTTFRGSPGRLMNVFVCPIYVLYPRVDLWNQFVATKIDKKIRWSTQPLLLSKIGVVKIYREFKGKHLRRPNTCNITNIKILIHVHSCESFQTYVFMEHLLLMSRMVDKLKISLRGKSPNTELFLVRIFMYSDWIQENTDQKLLHIWTFFTQCLIILVLLNCRRFDNFLALIYRVIVKSRGVFRT